MIESDENSSFAVVWEKCYFGNVDGEQIVWVCRTSEQARSVAAFLASSNPHLSTMEADKPRYTHFTTRPALPAEVAGCACLIKRLREQSPHMDDDAIKLSRLVLENHALLGVELPQEGFIARFTAPAKTSPRGISHSEGWRTVIEKLNVVAANTSHLANISAATQGTRQNTGRMVGAMENGLLSGDGRPPVPETREPKNFTVAAVLDLASISDTTLNEYAKRAGVTTPGRGKRNHVYTEDEVRKILQVLIDQTSDRNLKSRCQAALDNL